MKDVYTITTSAGPQDVKMTYGLLNVLCRTAGELDGAALMALDNDIREQMIIEMLSPRGPTGQITEAISTFHVDSTVEEISGLLSWAQEHIFDFFVKSATKSREVSSKHQASLEALQVSSAGGAGSASKKPSA